MAMIKDIYKIIFYIRKTDETRDHNILIQMMEDIMNIADKERLQNPAKWKREQMAWTHGPEYLNSKDPANVAFVARSFVFDEDPYSVEGVNLLLEISKDMVDFVNKQYELGTMLSTEKF